MAIWTAVSVILLDDKKIGAERAGEALKGAECPRWCQIDSHVVNDLLKLAEGGIPFEMAYSICFGHNIDRLRLHTADTAANLGVLFELLLPAVFQVRERGSYMGPDSTCVKAHRAEFRRPTCLAISRAAVLAPQSDRGPGSTEGGPVCVARLEARFGSEADVMRVLEARCR